MTVTLLRREAARHITRHLRPTLSGLFATALLASAIGLSALWWLLTRSARTAASAAGDNAVEAASQHHVASIAVLVLLIIGGSVAIVVNARCITPTRREDLVTLRWLGASAPFLRRPLLATGAFVGLLGGGLAGAVDLLVSGTLRRDEQQTFLGSSFSLVMRFPHHHRIVNAAGADVGLHYAPLDLLCVGAALLVFGAICGMTGYGLAYGWSDRRTTDRRTPSAPAPAPA